MERTVVVALYNRIPRPPVVMLSGGKPTLAVRRETVDDLTALDM